MSLSIYFTNAIFIAAEFIYILIFTSYMKENVYFNSDLYKNYVQFSIQLGELTKLITRTVYFFVICQSAFSS